MNGSLDELRKMISDLEGELEAYRNRYEKKSRYNEVITIRISSKMKAWIKKYNINQSQVFRKAIQRMGYRK